MANSGTLEAEREISESGGLLEKAIASLSIQIGQLRDRHDKEAAERRRINQSVFTIPDIPVGQITAASGTGSLLKQPEVAGPKTGQVWYVTRIGFQGLTAGQVNVFMLNENGTQLDSLFFVANTALSKFYGSTAFPLRAGQFLVFQAGASWAGATTITLGVTNVAAEYEGLYIL